MSGPLSEFSLATMAYPSVFPTVLFLLSGGSALSASCPSQSWLNTLATNSSNPQRQARRTQTSGQAVAHKAPRQSNIKSREKTTHK